MQVKLNIKYATLIQVIVAITIIIITTISPNYAQFQNGSNMSFGQNRIQYTTREWSYYRTDFADIYYYPQSKELAIYSASHLPSILTEMENKIGIVCSKKIQLVVYARQSDFQQSNIGLENDDFFNTGGVSYIYDHKVFLYFDGSIKDFHQKLRNGIARMLIAEYIGGNSIGSNIAASYVPAFPIWFTDGLSHYLANGFTKEIELQVKDGIKSGLYKKFYQLNVTNQITAGISIWNFIEKKYGINNLNIFLLYSASSHNYERACMQTFGMTFKDLLAEWNDYYEKNLPDSLGEEKIEEIHLKYKKNTQYMHPQISPDGTSLAYVTNCDGQIKIHILGGNNAKDKVIYKKNYRLDLNPDYTFPLIAWAPNGKFLTLAEEWHDKVYLRNYIIDEQKWDERQVIFINKIVDFQYSQDGKTIAMSAIQKGQSDIYLYNLSSRSLQQITNDLADDAAPCIVNNQFLIFSSNRNSDSLSATSNYSTDKYDLYLYDIKTENKLLTKLTNSPDKEEFNTINATEDYISFLATSDSETSRMLGKFENVISRIDTSIHYAYQVKNFPIDQFNINIKNQSIDNNQSIVYQQYYNHGQWKLGKNFYVDFSKYKIPDFNEQPIQTTNDSINNDENTDNQQLSTKKTKRLRQIKLSDVRRQGGDSTITSDNLSVTSNEEEKNEQLVPRNYYTQYYINKMVEQLDLSFLNMSYQQFMNTSSPIYLNGGLNAFFLVGLTDILENHRMVGGIRLSFTSLGNIEFLYSYENLEKRLDRQIVAYYQKQKTADNYNIILQQNASIFYLLKYPFDKAQSLRFTFELRYNRQDWKSISDYSLALGPQHSFWTGGKVEYILDFSRKLDANILTGFRGKIFTEASCTPAKEFKYMSVSGLDFRYYAPLARTLIWANRLSGSCSLGNAPLIYYLGGVDNWIFAKFNSEISIEPNINYAYQTLATPMRGFSQNIRNGNNFILFNTELRWQIIQTFVQKPLRSDFLRSFQLVGFFDAGTAWSGLNPYNKNNALYTRTITSGSNLRITIHKQTDPIVYGFGTGIRFMLFSYFLRFDYAWGIENGKISNHQFYLSLNLDF